MTAHPLIDVDTWREFRTTDEIKQLENLARQEQEIKQKRAGLDFAVLHRSEAAKQGAMTLADYRLQHEELRRIRKRILRLPGHRAHTRQRILHLFNYLWRLTQMDGSEGSLHAVTEIAKHEGLGKRQAERYLLALEQRVRAIARVTDPGKKMRLIVLRSRRGFDPKDNT